MGMPATNNITLQTGHSVSRLDLARWRFKTLSRTASGVCYPHGFRRASGTYRSINAELLIYDHQRNVSGVVVPVLTLNPAV